GNAAGPHAECPAGIALAVHAGRLEHRRMHHPRAQNLHPPRSLAARAAAAVAYRAADVHFRRRFGEGEITGAKARGSLAEEAIREIRERGLEIHEADAFVHRHAFDLREHRRMRRVEEIAAIY